MVENSLAKSVKIYTPQKLRSIQIEYISRPCKLADFKRDLHIIWSRLSSVMLNQSIYLKISISTSNFSAVAHHHALHSFFGLFVFDAKRKCDGSKQPKPSELARQMQRPRVHTYQNRSRDTTRPLKKSVSCLRWHCPLSRRVCTHAAHCILASTMLNQTWRVYFFKAW